MLKLSYIIPAYNASAFIRQSLDSIFALPLSENEYEVIVIDDCSTDDTLSIIEMYTSKHTNVIVLHQECNLRQGAARNKGIELAKGEYIAFCDADDVIVAEGVMNALKAVSETKVDICYFDFEYEQPKDEWHLLEMPKETSNTILRSDEYLENYYTCWYNGVCRNLYRREFLLSTGICFVEGVRWEDCDWTAKVYAKAKQIQFVGGVGYRYKQNRDNTCSIAQSPEGMAEQLYAGLRLLQFSDTIHETLPSLYKTLREEARFRYVVGVLRLRNISKYSYTALQKMYALLGDKHRKDLSKYQFTRWVNFCLHYEKMSLCMLSVISLSARVGRSIVKGIRKL